MISVEERRRRSHNFLLTAFCILIILWIWKLFYPQASLVRAYSDHFPSTPSPLDLEESSSSPIPEIAIGKHLKSYASDIYEGTFNGTITDKVAVIIESRFRSNLIPLILHFGIVLGDSWPIIILTSAESASQFSTSSALARYLQNGIMQVRVLPQDSMLTDADAMNRFLTQDWLWEFLSPAEHILLFQSDSMLCGNAARSVNDYFEYDFVGAPTAAGGSDAYNGGLSLRKRSSTLKVLEEWDYEDTKKNDKNDRYEDQWFHNRFVPLKLPQKLKKLTRCLRLKILQERDEAEGILPEEDDAINLPSVEVARTFSVKTVDYPHPLGVHQIHKWTEESLIRLTEWCPEYKLCSEDHVHD
ncbi:hypothetical protein LHYA1_G002311 [Lachnellula hyalina]|uniref:DUF5672 domain-containing protein n=1 Tax=Lachnellula hyalina TaxID=1316788 RepID=A0A8H8U1T3_9HELO|nr:uncharacterized protein LHYA1_G002311 [Lachnellula hyalina]TVY28630.1 hypothetical protein LHYA1_G002311 [Lachnellula hyalina]